MNLGLSTAIGARSALLQSIRSCHPSVTVAFLS